MLSLVMKNQYVGDINDYVKFGVLRCLARHGARLGVCWMLTADDSRTDGSHTDYLLQPLRYRFHDPDLFDVLNRIVDSGLRSTAQIERTNILPAAAYHSAILPVDPAGRRAYFRELEEKCRSCNLLFFDPDNGVEVPSVRKGQRGSEKYLFWDELARFALARGAALVYQHFPRVKRVPYIRTRILEMRQRLGLGRVVAFKAGRTAFFLWIGRRSDLRWEEALAEIRLQWTAEKGTSASHRALLEIVLP